MEFLPVTLTKQPAEKILRALQLTCTSPPVKK
jgi:hypothetical protein